MKKKYLLISLGVVIFSLLLAIVFYIVQIKRTKAILVGDKRVNHEVLTKYNDEGVILKRGNKIISAKKYKVDTKSDVNTDKIGAYKIKYDIKYSFKKLNLERIVNVVDTVKPELTINLTEVNRDFCTKKFKQEITYSALDNYDGDISSNVEVEETEDKMIYKVSDSSGNTDTKEVNIIYDKKPKNKFKLNGSATVNVVLNGTYNDAGASYVDGCGNKINKEIKVSGEVNTQVEGTYYITYEVEGENKLTRTINVKEKKIIPKTIYLTFDDGPGSNTKSILNTLSKYNVKATFFVTNQFPSYQYLIAEEYNQGHAVAVHTLTHNYNIYSSVDAYINDFNQMNEIIKNQTGSYSTLFRFPGGSSNTVSRKYATGIVTAIANEMTNRGFVYFDWNLSSGDASGANASKIKSNVINGVERCSSSCIVLMHDIKGTTRDALDGILADLTSKGYQFATLNASSPTAHHHINN